MNNRFAWMGVLGFAFLASACGGEGHADRTGGPSTPAVGQDQSSERADGPASGKGTVPGTQNCSRQLLNDFDAARDGAITSLEDLKALRARVAKFASKYRGVTCQMKNDRGQTETYDVTAVCADLIQQLDEAIKRWENG